MPLVIAVRVDDRGADFFLFDRTSLGGLLLLVVDIDVRAGFVETNDAFSLSLELRSMETARFAVDVALPGRRFPSEENKDLTRVSTTYSFELTIGDVFCSYLHVDSMVVRHCRLLQVVRNKNDPKGRCNS